MEGRQSVLAATRGCEPGMYSMLPCPPEQRVSLQVLTCSMVRQYPRHSDIKQTVDEYVSRMGQLAIEFMHHVAESLSLEPSTFDSFKGNMDRLKFVKYPEAAPDSQGVGPHKDSAGLFTFLSQDDTGGLQVLNKNGEWIDAPPIPGSLVVNIQQGFEAITGGVCPATTHRVIVSGHSSWAASLFLFWPGTNMHGFARPLQIGQDIASRSSRASGWI